MNQTIPFSRRLRLLLLLDAALLLAGLGLTPLSPTDEGQLGEAAREMVQGGDWITPRIGGDPFPPYPPLGYWLLAISGSIFGFNAFALRLPGVLASLGLVAVTARMTQRRAGDEAGLLAGAVLATLPSFFVQSGICRADVITTFFAVAAFDRFLAWAEGEKKNRDLALMYLFVSLGILTKGPLAVAVLGLGGLSWFLIHRRWKLLIGMKLWIGIPMSLVIIVPWYLAVYRINGGAFLHENLVLENFSAYSDGYQQKRPPTFYLRQLPLFLPWLLLLPLAWKTRRAPGVALGLVWLAGLFLFLQLSSSKRINYLTYACPALAMSAGSILAALWTSDPKLLRRSLLGFGAVLCTGGAVLAFLPPSIWKGDAIRQVASRMPLIGLAAGSIAAVVAGTAWRFGERAGTLAVAGSLALGFLGYGLFVNPRVNPDHRELADFCVRTSRAVPPGEPFYTVAPEGMQGIYHFYAGRVLPPRNGVPGYYLALGRQRDQLVQAGKTVQIVDSMLDPRGRHQYLLRVIP